MNFVSRESQIRGKQNSLFPQGTSHLVICYIAKQNKSKIFENRAEIPVITCNSSQHFTGNSELFPFDVIIFAMLPAHGIWRETVLLLDVM